MADFSTRKATLLGRSDHSRKGAIDESIAPLVDLLNASPAYCTTSSCSGRTTVFVSEQTLDDAWEKAKGGRWCYTTHSAANAYDLIESLRSVLAPTATRVSAVFKFEPFVLHVETRSIADAQSLLRGAMAAGCRNSGMTISKNGKIITAVRNTLTLEVPLVDHGVLLVTDEYIHHLVKVSNDKMKENNRRIARFYDFAKALPLLSQKEAAQKISSRKREKSNKEKIKKSDTNATVDEIDLDLDLLWSATT
ncbi:tRNA wybutosine-synthesizing protein 3 homolog [Oscarella lobularis]|uniref:tRNA wybutosine-synthesizing protein 3 homolog n=1 Tax=Oscarella lobularis TaxID=121494 RepID=UPI0033135EDB